MEGNNIKVLLNKQYNPDSNTIGLISSQILPETENITFEIIDNAPIIEERVGFQGVYIWNNETNMLDIEYIENPLSIDEQIQAMQDTIDALSGGSVK